MPRQIAKTTLAFVGLVVGAGFASGQEIQQYFVSYGISGIYGVVLTAIIMALSGLVILQLGSYFLAVEHTDVFGRIFEKWLARLVDVFLILVLFCLGFVMVAGAGSNLNQQFGLPVWVGSALVCLLVIAAGMLDVDKVMNVVGGITPFILVFVLGTAVYALCTFQDSWGTLDATAQTLESPLPNWPMAAINYVGLSLVLAISMAIVMGGDQLSTRVAGLGGFCGGLVFGAMMILSALALFVYGPLVNRADMPMLELVNRINPTLGVIMSIVVFGMIFNTAVCMFYALGKRAQGYRKSWYKPALIGSTIAGFGFSFLGFKTLVSHLFPILGWVGIVIIALMVAKWGMNRSLIKEEAERRGRILSLVARKLHVRIPFTKRDHRKLEKELAASPVADYQLHGQMVELAAERLEAAGEPVDKKIVKQTQKEVAAIEQQLAKQEAAGEGYDNSDDGFGPSDGGENASPVPNSSTSA